eukprot:CAMPEP_0182472324 /NCGR_PEP_ID=MMETSP1319-20130603/21978_1 /TAXON_ID=172717 /ORGANISM="Bolidomonas pacifica, Strain RCC208" /LENGTH=84 /DNA_ID=CAMNT_0024672991 /DNA_START=77 /DNA_END=328 /DNA_ORIENTATION=+
MDPRVKAALSTTLSLGKERKDDLIERTVKRFQRHPLDCGSASVQIAVLSRRISLLARHMEQHGKDNSSKRGLQQMIQKRRKMVK